MTFSNRAIKYFTHISSPLNVPAGIKIINPYKSKDVKKVVSEFFLKFYNDQNERLFLIGINPGRFGGGLTGISFTDPAALRKHCKIDNNLGMREELSSVFIYRMIEHFGGAEKFFRKAYLTAMYPLAIVKNGKNYNYYDEKTLFELLKGEILKAVYRQIEFGARRDKAIILGKKNAKFFLRINEEYNFFNKITVLDHPRYIMQYKLKQINAYLKKYINSIR